MPKNRLRYTIVITFHKYFVTSNHFLFLFVQLVVVLYDQTVFDFFFAVKILAAVRKFLVSDLSLFPSIYRYIVYKR